MTEAIYSIILIFTIVFGLFMVAAYFVYHAPWYFARLLVDSGKVRHRAAPKPKPLDFVMLPLLQSWLVAVLLLVHYELLWVILHNLPNFP